MLGHTFGLLGFSYAVIGRRSNLMLGLALLVAVLALAMTTGVLSSEPPPPTPPAPPDIPPGYTIIEGDIQVPIEWLAQPGLSAAWATNFWPNGIVPLEFDANVAQWQRDAMSLAMLEWQIVANVDFRPRGDGDANYVHIQASTENSSAVGMQGGMQIINIFDWNVRFIMVHELGHCLGLWHEQSRPNRDTFVIINLSNIESGMAHNFDKHSEAGQYPPNGYDFDSLMHYGQCAFSTNPTCPTGGGETITVLPPNQAWQTLIGQRNHLSQMDQLTMSFLYPRPNWRFVDGAYTGSTENGTFLMPYKQFPTGFAATPSGGTLWVQPGTYAAAGTYDKAMTIRAPLGGVALGP